MGSLTALAACVALLGLVACSDAAESAGGDSVSQFTGEPAAAGTTGSAGAAGAAGAATGTGGAAVGSEGDVDGFNLDGYRDTPGMNQSTEFRITLAPTATPGVLSFDDADFFPIDGMSFGNTPDRAHNYHFTFELHTEFTYNGGEVFTFTGDDDLWVFINGNLAIDLGGLHPELSESVSLDTVATQFGLVKGETYPLDLLSATRTSPTSASTPPSGSQTATPSLFVS